MSFVSSAGAGPQLCSMRQAANGLCAFEPDLDFEMESDIVDECGGLIDVFEEEDEEIPQRPSSRLGFHSSPSDNYAVDLEDPNETAPETMNWIQRSSNATIGDGTEMDSVDLASATTTAFMPYDMGEDEDITTVAPSDLQDEPGRRVLPRSIVRLNATPQLDDGRNPFMSSDDESDCSDDESDCSSCENSDEDFEFSLTPLTPPPSKFSSCMPLFAAPVARPLLSPIQSTRRPPSPTELPPTQIRLPSPRPNYNNHGYSRHALHHLKGFWSMREGKWAEHDARTRDSHAYGGMGNHSQYRHPSGSSPLRSPTQRNLAQRFKPRSPPPRDSSALPPMSVHPRRGDLASLRDPYCMHMDRCFVNMPSWTLSKTLYMFDVHVGHEWHSRVAEMNKWKKHRDDASDSGPEVDFCPDLARKEPSCDTLDDVDLDSENESLGASASVVSSDDSDATLVESENEGDLEREDYSTFEAFMSGTGPPSPSSSSENNHNTPRLKTSSTSSHSGKSSSKCPFSPSLYARIPPPSCPDILSHLNDAEEPPKPWATNWYRRWEILMDLMRFNWDQRQLSAALSINERPYSVNNQSSRSTSRDADIACRKGKRRLRRQPRFYLTDESSSEDSDSWEWDSSFDWKNKAQVSEPNFGLGVTAMEGSVLL